MTEQKSLLTELGEALDRYRMGKRALREAQANRSPQPTSLRRLLRWFTPNGGTLLLVIVLIATAQVWASPLTSPTTAPGPSATTVNYQGQLADIAGVPLDGIYGMTFALYDAATGGNLIWGPESYTAVEVSDGLFSVGLGSKTSGGIPTTTWSGDRYLEITVAGEKLEPRELIRSVPIAGMALTVPDGAINSRNISNDKNAYVEQQEAIFISGDGEWNDLDGMSVTITPDVDSYVYAYASAYAQNGIESLFTLRAVLDDGQDESNVGVGGMTRRQSSETTLYYGGATVVTRFELNAGMSHTIKLQGRVNYVSGARVRHRSMSLIVVKR